MNEQIEGQCLALGHLPDEPSRSEFLQRAPELRDFQVVQQLAEAVRTTVRVDVRKALTLAGAALSVARELRSDEALALAFRAKANALWFLGDCKSAVALFKTAADLFEQTGQMSELGRTLSGSIQSLALLGDYNQAFELAERAKKIFTGLGESWRVARVEINLANIYHRQNRYREALAAYERAYEELLPHRDVEGIGVALHNMAVCLIALDDFAGALATYHRVRNFCEQHEMPLLVAQADYNIAYLYYLRGDYTEALSLLQTTAEGCRESGDSYHRGLCDLDRSEIYLELNLVDEAAEMAQSSVEHFRQLGMGFELARSLTNLAIAVNAQGDQNRALDLFDRAKDVALGEDNQVWPHLIDLYRIVVLLDRKELRAAVNAALSTADFFCSARLPTKHALALLLLTRAYLEAGDLDNAAERCKEILAVLDDISSPILLQQAHFLRGQIYERAGDADKAYHAYQESRANLEVLRSGLQRDELKLGFMRGRLDVYSRLIRICLERDPEETLFFIEAAKSRSLRDLILGEAEPALLQAGSRVDQRARELRSELNWYYHRIENEQLSRKTPAVEEIEALRNQASEREHEFARLLTEAPASVAAVTFQGPVAPALQEVRRALGHNAALLEYFSVDDHTHVVLITAETVKIIPLVPAADLAHRLRMLQFQLSKFRLGQEYVSRFQQPLLNAVQGHLQQLYRDLISPIENLLAAQSLVVVPFGPLHSLPFHALFDGQNYLIDRFAISYAPSASIFVHVHREMNAPLGKSLILGVEDPGLPFIQDEIQAVAEAVPEPLVLFGGAATEQALRAYGPHSRLIHIASHGYFRQDNPMFSAIRLADSYVNLYDLYHLNLPVDLLTLSGCVTGMNVVSEGDELLGLTRGLLYAGARSLLLSLWDVDDRSTSEFMRDFYFQLQTLPRKVDALRVAMLNLRNRYAHPFYWAPFKLTGRALF